MTAALSLIFPTACTMRHTVGRLKDIETYIQERPDSALKVLRTVDTSLLRSSAAKARYALLYTMALEKNCIDTTDLHVIRPAVAYYARHGTPAEKMNVFFYQGCIYANRREDDRAMNSYLLALEDSGKVADNHCKELVNSAISDVFARNHNTHQELRYTEAALRYGRLAGDSAGVWAITGHLATCLGKLRRYEEAEKAYDLFFSLPVQDSLVYAWRKIDYAKNLIRKPDADPQQSADILEAVAATIPQAMDVEAYCVYAYARQALGHEAIADEILKQLESCENGRDHVKAWRYRIYREQGYFEQALADLEQSVLAQDSIVLSMLNQSLVRVQRDYFESATKLLKKENEAERQKVLLILAGSLLALGMALALHQRKTASFNRKWETLSALHLRSQQMLDLQSAETAAVHARLTEKEAALRSLQEQHASLFKARYKTLNDLCSAYLSPIKKARKDLLYDEAMRQLDMIVNDKASHEKFMSLVNVSLDNIIDKLRHDLPNRKEADFRFLTFVIVGFDALTISNLTGYSIGTVYTKKNRLKGEISRLSSPHKDFYLRFIE